MFEGVIGVVAWLAILLLLLRQRSRLRLLERELAALRSLVRSMPGAAPAEVAQRAPETAQRAPEMDASPAEKAASPAEEEVPAGPWSTPAVRPETPLAAAAVPARPDLETALGTRWAVWVGGIALALGGIFLVRYSIEAGLFGPAARLTLAALFGLVLVAAGEVLRRTGYRVPLEGIESASLPGILTAAGAFTLFGTIYAAHGIYGFLGASAAFALLGLVALGTIAAALVHGRLLAGIGLLGSYATPVLVASTAPSPWALFGFLAVVLAASAVIAARRAWRGLMTAAIAGIGLWCLAYLLDADPPALAPIAFAAAAVLAVLTVVWLGNRPAVDTSAPAGMEWPSAAAALTVGLIALSVAIDPLLAAAGGAWLSLLLVAALLAAALWRAPAVALLHAAGAVVVLVHLRMALSTDATLDLWHHTLDIEGLPPAPVVPLAWLRGLTATLLFLAAGLWKARRLAAAAPVAAAAWAAWAGLVPLLVGSALWVAFGDLDRDLAYAAPMLLLAVALAGGAEWVADAEAPARTGGRAVSLLLAGAAAAWAMAVTMACGPGLTTVVIGLSAALPALATSWRRYPALGWLAAAAAGLTLLRVAIDPTIVGPTELGTTPVLNALLPGYALPAAGFGFAAWQLRRTTGGRPALVLEAASALFALLALAMLVRHAMHGGRIDDSAPSLAEQAIYTLIAIGAGAILVALDGRAPSPVFRWGALGLAVASVALAALQHLVLLDPLFTNELTGAIPVFNLLFLAYFLPAAAFAALALYARGRRPAWYVGMLAGAAAVMLFAYATLSLRRLFHGEFIGIWKGASPLETYAYSALWLLLGLAVLAAGLRLRSRPLRLASAALVIAAVAKVFLIDMSELEGVLRALSFIGLGAALIGIGLFYQRMLAGSRNREPPQEVAAKP